MCLFSYSKKNGIQMCVSLNPDNMAYNPPVSRYYNTLISRDLRGKTRGVPLRIGAFYIGIPPRYTRIITGGVPYVFGYLLPFTSVFLSSLLLIELVITECCIALSYHVLKPVSVLGLVPCLPYCGGGGK